MKKNFTRSFSCDNELHIALCKLVRKENSSLSEIIRNAVKEYIQNRNEKKEAQ